MKFEYTNVYNFENAIRGMRHALQSYDKSDSYEVSNEYVIGENDLDLMQRLIKGGSEHRKYLRQIFVSVDITASLYWWKEMDTYKVGTTANSTSSMHKLASTPITKDCFEMSDYNNVVVYESGVDLFPDVEMDNVWETLIRLCERLRTKYNETKNKAYWKELIRILPESWLQTRTWTANYEVIRNIVHQRQGHKLKEWEAFINWAKSLPYAEELIFYK